MAAAFDLLHCLVILVIFGLATVNGLDISNKKVTIKSLHACKGMENLPMRWYDFNLKFNETSKEYLLNFKCKISKEVSTGFGMSFSFLKCDSSGNPDSCEYMIKDYRNDETCKFLTMKNQVWTIFVDHFDKPLVCPLKPGIYSNVATPIRGDFLRLLPIPDAVWKIKIYGFDQGKTISCADGEIQISSVRTG